MTEAQQAVICGKMEVLRRRHTNYGILYSKFARLEIATKPPESPEDEKIVDEENQEETGNDQDNDEIINEEQEEEEITKEPKTIQVFERKLWERYLEDTDAEQSILTLQTALDLAEPLDSKTAFWIFQLRDCSLFMNKLWQPMVESVEGIPFCKKDLEAFVVECAVHWYNLARVVSEGSTSFQQMDEIVLLQPHFTLLSQKHLNRGPVVGVEAAYRNFENIQELRHLVAPFVVALRLFSIKEREQIDQLHHRVVKGNLLKINDETTLAQVTETVITGVLKSELNINPDVPQSRDAMKFLSSLVTDGNRSPLIEWLKEKTEKDMEAMGKILQGSLLEAYGIQYIL